MFELVWWVKKTKTNSIVWEVSSPLQINVNIDSGGYSGKL